MSGPQGPAGLVRGLGPVEATTLVVGGIIGSGIFLAPAIVAREVGSPGLSLLVWLAAGILATSGALCYAELGAAIPETGGTYAFLKRTFRGRLPAFLFGWMFFFVAGPGAVAAVAVAFATYAGYFLARVMPWGEGSVRVLAIAAIAALSLVQCLGVRQGGRVQNLLTGLKLATLAAIIILPLAAGDGSFGRLAPLLPADRSGLALAFGAAMIPTLFAYSGWTFSTYVAGEVRDPGRNVPRSILIGMAVVMTVYLGVNVAYLYVLPFAELQASTLVATDALRAAVGPWGSGFVAAAVVVSTLGALNAGVLAYPRIGFALARDGLFFDRVGEVHRGSSAPRAAILVQAAVACGFAGSGGYERILGYFAFVDYAFFALAVAGLFVLRRREPDLPRPYRVWAYPVPPVLFLLVSGAYLATVLVERPAESLVGLTLTLSGLPFYLRWSQRVGQVDPVAAARRTAD